MRLITVLRIKRPRLGPTSSIVAGSYTFTSFSVASASAAPSHPPPARVVLQKHLEVLQDLKELEEIGERVSWPPSSSAGMASHRISSFL